MVRAVASFSRLSPSRIVTIRRGTGSRVMTAVAAISSGGATIAPRARATAHGRPGINTHAVAPAASALPTTRPTASEAIEPRFVLRRRSGV